MDQAGDIEINILRVYQCLLICPRVERDIGANFPNLNITIKTDKPTYIYIYIYFAPDTKEDPPIQ